MQSQKEDHNCTEGTLSELTGIESYRTPLLHSAALPLALDLDDLDLDALDLGDFFHQAGAKLTKMHSSCVSTSQRLQLLALKFYNA